MGLDNVGPDIPATAQINTLTRDALFLLLDLVSPSLYTCAKAEVA